MASLPPSKCCIVANFHEGTPVGKHQSVYDLDTYVTGTNSERLIVIMTDLIGHKFNNVLLVADEFARNGYKVLVPDILKGDAYDITQGEGGIYTWLESHTSEITRPIVDEFLAKLRKDVGAGVFVGVVGYCFGAKYAAQQAAADGFADAIAIAHPSFVSIEEVEAIKKPIIISAATNDVVFPAELRHLTEAKLIETGARFQINLFSGVEHGYSVRGDIMVPEIKYAKEKTLADQLSFFSLF